MLPKLVKTELRNVQAVSVGPLRLVRAGATLAHIRHVQLVGEPDNDARDKARSKFGGPNDERCGGGQAVGVRVFGRLEGEERIDGFVWAVVENSELPSISCQVCMTELANQRSMLTQPKNAATADELTCQRGTAGAGAGAGAGRHSLVTFSDKFRRYSTRTTQHRQRTNSRHACHRRLTGPDTFSVLLPLAVESDRPLHESMKCLAHADGVPEDDERRRQELNKDGLVR